MSLEKDLSEAISKNLSAEVGLRLQGILRQAESDATLVLNQKATLISRDKTISLLQEKLNAHDTLTERDEALKIREESVNKLEQELEIQILTIKLEESEKRADMISGYTSGLVRNTLMRKNIFDSETANNGMPIMDGNGNAHYPIATEKSHTSSTEVE